MIQIEVAPDIEQRFADAARARGLQPEVYAGQLIESAALRSRLPGKPVDADAFLAGMLAYSDKTPALSEEAFTRESFYQDHD